MSSIPPSPTPGGNNHDRRELPSLLPANSREAVRLVAAIWGLSSSRTKLFLALASVACFALFSWMGKAAGIPELPKFDGSLLRQESPGVAVFITAVAIIASVVIGTVIAGGVAFEAGLLAAAIGLIGLSVRGGSAQPVLFGKDSPAIYLLLAFETILIFGFLYVGWLALPLIRKALGIGPGAPQPHAPVGMEGLAEPESTPGNNLLAMLITAAVTGAGMLVLAQSEAKNQVLAAVFLSALLGGIAAYFTFPTATSLWVWLGPGVAAGLGYLFAYLSPAGLAIGFPQGSFGPLARALPLDYAGAGVAGAILGFWMGRRWQHESEQSAESASNTAA